MKFYFTDEIRFDFPISPGGYYSSTIPTTTHGKAMVVAFLLLTTTNGVQLSAYLLQHFPGKYTILPPGQAIKALPNN